MNLSRLYIALFFCLLFLASCQKKKETNNIIIEIPEHIAKEMGCTNMRATLSEHFSEDISSSFADYKNLF